MSSTEVQKAVSRIQQCEQRINQLSATIGQIRANDEKTSLIRGPEEEIDALQAEIATLKSAHSIGYAVWACNWNGNTYIPQQVVSELFTERVKADGVCAQTWLPKKVNKKVDYAVFITSLDSATGKYSGHY